MENDQEVQLGHSKLNWLDLVVIGIYFLLVLAVGLWSSKRSAKSSISGYFLASRNMHWIPVGASLFASNIGSGHFVGLAGSAAASGIGIAFFEIHGAFMLLLLGWVFVPVYMAAGVYTMPEYLQKRFGGQRIRIYLSVLSLILYVFTKISADLFAGAIFIEQALGWNLYLAVVLLLSVAAIFTISGGLTAVMWTDFVQTILMVIGSFILMIISFMAIGGYDELWIKYIRAEAQNVTYDMDTNVSCGKPPEDSFHLFRSSSSTDLPWTGVIFGLTISATWYWCTDQVIVQRALAAKNLSHAKAGTILAGYLKVLPLFLLVFPGMISRVLYTEEVGCSTPEKCIEVCGNPRGCSNIAYPLLVLRLMPIGKKSNGVPREQSWPPGTKSMHSSLSLMLGFLVMSGIVLYCPNSPLGLSGMMLAVMLAALMSSLTSIFNSSSTIFTMDIWPRIRNNPGEWELLIVGRLFVVALIIVSIVWIPVIKASRGSQLFVYVQSITSYLAPPVCAVYVLAIMWPRTNEKGAFWGLMIGLIIGLIRFVVEFIFSAPFCGSFESETRPMIIIQLIGKIHYLHFGIILFFLTLLIVVTISLCTEPIDPIYMHRLTFWSRYSHKPRFDIDESQRKSQPEEIIVCATTVNKQNQFNIISSDVFNESTNKDIYHFHSKEAILNNTSMPGEGNSNSSNTCLTWKKLFYVLCGISKSDSEKDSSSSFDNNQGITKQQNLVEQAEAAVKYVEERNVWKWACNVNAICLLAAVVAVCIYYA